MSAPKRPGLDRLVDYFLVLGAKDNERLQPMGRHTRSNSQLIQPIQQLMFFVSKGVGKQAADDLPQGWEKVRGVSGRDPVELSSTFHRPKMFVSKSHVFLCESREAFDLPDNTSAGRPAFPITDIQVLYLDKREEPPEGFSMAGGTLNKGGLGRHVGLCVERDSSKDPITQILILNSKKGHHCPPGYQMVPRSLTEGGMGPRLFLCFKRRTVQKEVWHTPQLLDRYPSKDHPDYALDARGVGMLCFPRGMRLRHDLQLPTSMTFVLTQQDGSEVYGASLIFYQQQKSAEASPTRSSFVDTPSNKSLYLLRETAPPVFLPKCLCILSHWPFYQSFTTYLMQLYRASVSTCDVPLERLIANLLHDVPIPNPRQAVRLSIAHAQITFTRPGLLDFALKDFSLTPLFSRLSLQHICSIFGHVLAEGKTVFYSDNFEVLNPVAEALRTLIFPLQWQCVFIPVLPSNIAYTVRAPVPFLVGVHRSFVEEMVVPPSVLLVDLDRDALRMPEPNSDEALAPLPASIATELMAELQPFAVLQQRREQEKQEADVADAEMRGNRPADSPPDAARNHDGQDGPSSPQPPGPRGPIDSFDEITLDGLEEDKVRVAFLRVTIFLLSRYRKYVIFKEEENALDLEALFDRPGYIASFARADANKSENGPLGPEENGAGDPALMAFVQQFAYTQLFAGFVMNRVLHTDRPTHFLFFDWCMSLALHPECQNHGVVAVSAGPANAAAVSSPVGWSGDMVAMSQSSSPSPFGPRDRDRLGPGPRSQSSPALLSHYNNNYTHESGNPQPHDATFDTADFGKRGHPRGRSGISRDPSATRLRDHRLTAKDSVAAIKRKVAARAGQMAQASKVGAVRAKEALSRLRKTPRDPTPSLLPRGLLDAKIIAAVRAAPQRMYPLPFFSARTKQRQNPHTSSSRLLGGTTGLSAGQNGIWDSADTGAEPVDPYSDDHVLIRRKDDMLVRVQFLDVPGPDSSHLPKNSWTYDEWPELMAYLFPVPRPAAHPALGRHHQALQDNARARKNLRSLALAMFNRMHEQQQQQRACQKLLAGVRVEKKKKAAKTHLASPTKKESPPKKYLFSPSPGRQTRPGNTAGRIQEEEEVSGEDEEEEELSGGVNFLSEDQEQPRVIYELWTALFTEHCLRLRLQARHQLEVSHGLVVNRHNGRDDGPVGTGGGTMGRGGEVTDKRMGQLIATGPGKSIGNPGRPASQARKEAKAATLENKETVVALTHLLVLLIEWFSMVGRGVLPSETMLKDAALFCSRTGLERELQLVYRLLASPVPLPSPSFFTQLITSSLPIHLQLPPPLASANLPGPDPLNMQFNAATLDSALPFPALISPHNLPTNLPTILSPSFDASRFSPSAQSPPLYPTTSTTTTTKATATTTTTTKTTTSSSTYRPTGHLYDLPEQAYIQAQCSVCGYELSGDEIASGWLSPIVRPAGPAAAARDSSQLASPGLSKINFNNNNSNSGSNGYIYGEKGKGGEGEEEALPSSYGPSWGEDGLNNTQCPRCESAVPTWLILLFHHSSVFSSSSSSSSPPPTTSLPRPFPSSSSSTNQFGPKGHFGNTAGNFGNPSAEQPIEMESACRVRLFRPRVLSQKIRNMSRLTQLATIAAQGVTKTTAGSVHSPFDPTHTSQAVILSSSSASSLHPSGSATTSHTNTSLTSQHSHLSEKSDADAMGSPGPIGSFLFHVEDEETPGSADQDLSPHTWTAYSNPSPSLRMGLDNNDGIAGDKDANWLSSLAGLPASPLSAEHANSSLLPQWHLDLVRSTPELFWNLFWYFATRGERTGGYGQLPVAFLFHGVSSPETHLLLSAALHPDQHGAAANPTEPHTPNGAANGVRPIRYCPHLLPYPSPWSLRSDCHSSQNSGLSTNNTYNNIPGNSQDFRCPVAFPPPPPAATSAQISSPSSMGYLASPARHRSGDFLIHQPPDNTGGWAVRSPLARQLKNIMGAKNKQGIAYALRKLLQARVRADRLNYLQATFSLIFSNRRVEQMVEDYLYLTTDNTQQEEADAAFLQLSAYRELYLLSDMPLATFSKGYRAACRKLKQDLIAQSRVAQDLAEQATKISHDLQQFEQAKKERDAQSAIEIVPAQSTSQSESPGKVMGETAVNDIAGPADDVSEEQMLALRLELREAQRLAEKARQLAQATQDMRDQLGKADEALSRHVIRGLCRVRRVFAHVLKEFEPGRSSDALNNNNNNNNSIGRTPSVGHPDTLQTSGLAEGQAMASALTIRKRKSMESGLAGVVSLALLPSYDSFLDQILVNELPSLEDVLTESHQNPRYSLASLTMFCRTFPPGILHTASTTVEDKQEQPRQKTQALKALELWLDIHQFTLRYSRNLTARTPSLMGTSPSEVQDALYNHAKKLFDTHLLDSEEFYRLEVKERQERTDKAKMEKEKRANEKEQKEISREKKEAPLDVEGVSDEEKKEKENKKQKEKKQKKGKGKGAKGKGKEGEEAAGPREKNGNGAGEDKPDQPDQQEVPSSPVHHQPAAAGKGGTANRDHSEASGGDKQEQKRPTPASPRPAATIIEEPSVVTRCGLAMPVPLLSAVRAQMDRTVEVTYVDPLFGTEINTVQHHTVPITLFDRVQKEAFKWLKNKVFSSWVSRTQELIAAETEALADQNKDSARDKSDF